MMQENTTGSRTWVVEIEDRVIYRYFIEAKDYDDAMAKADAESATPTEVIRSVDKKTAHLLGVGSPRSRR